MKKISILGSTGSIGTQTLEVVRENPELRVTALAAGRNAALLEAQAREFRPGFVCLMDEAAAGDLRVRLADTDIRVLSGMEGLLEAAVAEEADMVVTAVVGMIGIRPTIAAIEAGKDIALANKETLVTAGHLIMPFAKERGVDIFPVDSEHSAIFQCLNGEEGNRIDKILLTASGGPFRGKTRKELAGVRLEDALKHPTRSPSTLRPWSTRGWRSWRRSGSSAWEWTMCRWWSSPRASSIPWCSLRTGRSWPRWGCRI